MEHPFFSEMHHLHYVCVADYPSVNTYLLAWKQAHRHGRDDCPPYTSIITHCKDDESESTDLANAFCHVPCEMETDDLADGSTGRYTVSP